MGARGEVPAAPADAALLAPYLPRAVIRELALEPAAAVRSLPGTLVFADVTGFTRLSERLARIGAEGAEQISDAIGASFATLLEVAYANGGGLLKFGGDALLLFFEGDGHAERACRAAIGMRRALRAAGAIATPGGRTALRMSVGVHTGTLHLFLAGRSHREPVVAGPAVTAVLRMERAARAGDIVVSPAVAALLPARSLGAPAGAGRLLRAAPGERDFAPEEPPAEADAARLALGLPVGRAPPRARRRRGRPSTGSSRSPSCASAAPTRGSSARGLDAAAEAIDELVVARAGGGGRARGRAPGLRRRRRRRQAHALRGRAARRRRRGGADAADAPRASPSASGGCRCRPASTAAGRSRATSDPTTAAPTRRWATW